jgi:hypothetical protein
VIDLQFIVIAENILGVEADVYHVPHYDFRAFGGRGDCCEEESDDLEIQVSESLSD